MGEPITKTKILTILLIIGGFGLIVYAIAKTMASTCGNDMVYNKDMNKCIPKCKDNEKYYPNINKCLRCPPWYGR